MAGGTFWQNVTDEETINTTVSGYFLILSGLLANATSNSTCLDAAKLSFQFIYSHLYSRTIDGLVSDRITSNCSGPAGAVVDDTALFLEGTAILGSITNNKTLKDLVVQLSQSAISYPDWQNFEGILYSPDHQSVGRGYDHLVRALTVVHELYTDNQSFQDYIESFINVQYNAVLDVALGVDNVYAEDWDAKPTAAVSYSVPNQDAATEVLLSGLQLASRPSSSSSGSSIPKNSSSNRSTTGFIVGGVIGGVAVVLGLVTSLLYWRRRKRRAAASHSLTPLPPPRRSSDSIRRRHGSQQSAFWQSPPGDGLAFRSEKNLHSREDPSGTRAVPLVTSGLPSSAARTSSIAPESGTGSNGFHDVQTREVASSGARGGLTTGELVGMLNDRLRRGSVVWHEEETPPVYGTSERGE